MVVAEFQPEFHLEFQREFQTEFQPEFLQPELQRVPLVCGRHRGAKLLGDALLSLRLMSIGCS